MKPVTIYTIFSVLLGIFLVYYFVTLRLMLVLVFRWFFFQHGNYGDNMKDESKQFPSITLKCTTAKATRPQNAPFLDFLEEIVHQGLIILHFDWRSLVHKNFDRKFSHWHFSSLKNASIIFSLLNQCFDVQVCEVGNDHDRQMYFHYAVIQMLNDNSLHVFMQ